MNGENKMQEEIEKNLDQETKEIINTPVANDKQEELIKRSQRMTLKCVHLGEQLEKPQGCACKGMPKHKCEIHGECRVAGTNKQTKLCIDCDDYKPVSG